VYIVRKSEASQLASLKRRKEKVPGSLMRPFQPTVVLHRQYVSGALLEKDDEEGTHLGFCKRSPDYDA
jgi:hypothetical protein